MNKDDLAREIGVDSLEVLPRDVSPREYFRGSMDGRDFVVMLYPKANKENKAELRNFIRIGEWLAQNGVKAPALYDVHEAKCFAVFEDLGRVSFGRRLRENRSDQKALYTLGADVLKMLASAHVPEGLPLYKDSRIHENRKQFVAYYMALLRGRASDTALVQSYLSVWEDIERTLPPCPQGFVHGDFHLENLIYAENESGVKRCALIDYQDALRGPLPYDLLNLLEDARVDVPQDLREAMINRYCAEMDAADRAVFLQWYRVLAAQFHGRVIGLFIKLAAEQGRDSYLVHIPRLQSYLSRSVQDPILAPLKAWFEKEGVDFSPINDLDGNYIRAIF